MSRHDTNVTELEFIAMRDYIRRECGVDLPDEKAYLIEARLSGLLRDEKCETYMELHNKALADTSRTIRDKIIDVITTNETLWFRDDRSWDCICERLLPEFIEGFKQSGRRFRVWSAGCSTGQEPYSLAMICAEALHRHGLHLKDCMDIVGTDISSTALGIAKTGVYNQITISRGMRDAYLKRHFKHRGHLWQLKAEIREAVTFKKSNLLNPLDIERKFDMILCRNVAIYFSDEFRRILFANITNSLRRGGYLFLGSSESLLPDLSDYEILESGVCFRLKNGEA
ncbi:CheR family methyltransferase [Planctomycetota bacterium]